MPVRDTDYDKLDRGHTGVRIERTIPLWGIIGLVLTIAGQGILVWNGQEKQAVQMANQSEKIKEMSLQLNAIAERQSTKDMKDVEQDLRITDLSRRLIVLETPHSRGAGATSRE